VSLATVAAGAVVSVTLEAVAVIPDQARRRGGLFVCFFIGKKPQIFQIFLAPLVKCRVSSGFFVCQREEKRERSSQKEEKTTFL